MYEAGWYVWAMVLTAVLGLCLSVGFILYRGGIAARMQTRTVRRLTVTGVLVLIGWLAVSWTLAGAGYYADLSRPLEVIPSTAALAQLPLALIPTVAVPIVIALHIAALTRLRALADDTETRLVAEPT